MKIINLHRNHYKTIVITKMVMDNNDNSKPTAFFEEEPELAAIAADT